MALTGFLLVIRRNLFAVSMLGGLFSLSGALLYVVMDAVDVAFTEAAVGAGVSTVLMLGTLALIKTQHEKLQAKTRVWPILVVLFTGSVLVYGTFDMPHYGDPRAPIHHHVAPHYITESGKEVGPPNIVTSILASYRGFDTLGETFVVFTAAIGVLVIIGRGRRREEDSDT